MAVRVEIRVYVSTVLSMRPIPMYAEPTTYAVEVSRRIRPPRILTLPLALACRICRGEIDVVKSAAVPAKCRGMRFDALIRAYPGKSTLRRWVTSQIATGKMSPFDEILLELPVGANRVVVEPVRHRPEVERTRPAQFE